MYAKALKAPLLLKACHPGLKAKLEIEATGGPPSFCGNAERFPGSITVQGQTPFPWDLLLSRSTLPELHLLQQGSQAWAWSWAVLMQPICGPISWPGLFVLGSLPSLPRDMPDPRSPHWTFLGYLSGGLLSALPRSAPGSPSLTEQPALTAPQLSNLCQIFIKEYK